MIQDLTEKGYRIAQDIAPKDTMNLVLNAMRYTANENIGEIVYDDSVAPYIDYLEEGTKNYDGAKGFIAIDTVDSIKAMIYSSQNGQFDQDYGQQYQAASELKPTQRTNARFLKAIGGEALVSK
jgi:hypothetical protein